MVNCRLNNKQNTHEREIKKLSLPSNAILNLSRYLRNRKTSNYSDMEESTNVNDNSFAKVNDQSSILELFRCAETTNSTLSLCLNKTNIPKVTFQSKKTRKIAKEKVRCSNTPTINKLVVISHLLLAINSSANVIIYMLKGTYYNQFFLLSFQGKISYLV